MICPINSTLSRKSSNTTSIIEIVVQLHSQKHLTQQYIIIPVSFLSISLQYMQYTREKSEPARWRHLWITFRGWTGKVTNLTCLWRTKRYEQNAHGNIMIYLGGRCAAEIQLSGLTQVGRLRCSTWNHLSFYVYSPVSWCFWEYNIQAWHAIFTTLCECLDLLKKLTTCT